MDELADRAARLGADAVVGIDIDYEVLGENNGMMMVTASGTAVKLDYRISRAIAAQASASARAWWWLRRSKPQAAATVSSRWFGRTQPKRRREAASVSKKT